MGQNPDAVEPRFNEVAGDRPIWSLNRGFGYIENLDITNLRGNDQNVRYIEVIVNDWSVTQLISVEIIKCQCRWHIYKPLTERLLSLPQGLKDLLTVDLLSVYLFSRDDIAFRYIEVDFTFGLPEYVRYIEKFVISRFYSIHCTVTLAGT